jgi:MFS family permease
MHPASPIPVPPEVDRTSAKYRRRWWTLAVLSLSLVIIGLDNTVLNVAIPTLQREFDASASQLQWMVDAYVVFAGLLLTLGALGDRFGRGRALHAGLAMLSISGISLLVYAIIEARHCGWLDARTLLAFAVSESAESGRRL